MKKLLKLSFTSLLLPLSTTFAAAQEVAPMADGLRAEGKIYVVVAILLIILLGLLGYVFMIDRKIYRLEKKFDEKP